MSFPHKKDLPSKGLSTPGNGGKVQNKLRKMQTTSNLFQSAATAASLQPDLPPISGLPFTPLESTTAQNRFNLRRFKSHFNLQQSQKAAEAHSEDTTFTSHLQVKIPPRVSSNSFSANYHPIMTSPLGPHEGEAFTRNGKDLAQEQSTSETAIGNGDGEALVQAAENLLGDASTMMGKDKAPAQEEERPVTRGSTLVPSIRQSLRSTLTGSTKHGGHQFGTTTTITASSGDRDGPIKRLVKKFQRTTGKKNTENPKNTRPDGLDPEMTCIGLPGIHYAVKVTKEEANPPPGSDLHSEPEVISHFEVTKNFESNNDSSDANDESLQRYKQSLGLGGGKDLSDPNDPRVCIIHALTMESPGRDPVTIDLSQPGSEVTLKDKPFKIKEGSKFTMVVTFKVQHEILSGLQYVQVVKRKGLKVGKDSEMLVSSLTNSYKFYVIFPSLY